MKPYILITLTLLLFTKPLFAQVDSIYSDDIVIQNNSADTIQYLIKYYGSNHYARDFKFLNSNEMHNTLNRYNRSYSLYKTANVLKGTGLALEIAGVGTILYYIYHTIYKGELDEFMPLIGVGITLLGIPARILSMNLSTKAMRLYNNEIMGRTSSISPEVKLYTTGSSIGIALNF